MEILLKGKRAVAGSFYAGGINDIFMIFSIVKRTTWRWDGCSSGRWRKTASKGHPTDTAAGSSSWPVAVPITHSKFTVLGWTPPAPIDGPIVVERCNQVGNDTTNTKAVTFVLVDRPLFISLIRKFRCRMAALALSRFIDSLWKKKPRPAEMKVNIPEDEKKCIIYGKWGWFLTFLFYWLGGNFVFHFLFTFVAMIPFLRMCYANEGICGRVERKWQEGGTWGRKGLNNEQEIIGSKIVIKLKIIIERIYKSWSERERRSWSW